jgi:hypothetical protein
VTAPGSRTLRIVAAALLLASGAIHVVLALDGYGTSTFETLFLLNGAISAVIAVAIVVARGPLPALGGLAVAGGTLLAFAVSRVGAGIFGFRATGLDPSPEAPLAILIQVSATAVLAVLAFRDREPIVGALRDARAEVVS